MTLAPFIISGIFFILIVMGVYIFKNYITPKKVQDIEQLIKMGNYKLAINKLQQLLEKDERNPSIHYLLAMAYEKKGDLQMAVVEYRQVIKIGKFDSKISEKKIRNKLAEILFEKKDYDNAIKEYLILTKIDELNAEPFKKVGEIYFLSNRYDKALPYLKQATKLNPKDADAFFYAGQIEYSLNKYSDAKVDLTNCIKLNPKHYKAHYYLGLALKQFKDYDWAIKEFEISEKDSELKAKSLLAKGLCYLERNQVSKAIIEFERGIKVAAKGTDTYLNLAYFLGDAYEKTRDIPSAIKYWEAIHEINPKFRDVAEKLKFYDEFRTDDNLKDFMIASISQFENLSKKIAEALELMPLEVNLIDDTAIDILANEVSGKWRNSRKNRVILKIRRTAEPINESLIRKIQEDIKATGANRGICIATTEFAPTAQAYVQSRPIDLLGKKELSKLLQKIK